MTEGLILRDGPAAAGSACDCDWLAVPMTDLTAHLVSAHHARCAAEFPRLSELMRRVLRRHGERYWQLAYVQTQWEQLRIELEAHLQKEERVLFPWVTRLELARTIDGVGAVGIVGPIACMAHEHDDAGSQLVKLRIAADDYRLPRDACDDWRVLYDGFVAFEADLERHIVEENELLFPRVVARESELSSAQL